VSVSCRRVVVCLACLAALGVACNFGAATAPLTQVPTEATANQPSSATATPASAEPTIAQAEPTASGGGRDYASLDVCQLLPGSVVESLTQGTQLQDPQSTSGGDLAGCYYEIQPGGTGTYANYIVYVEPADFVQANLAISDAGDPVPGLGDQAYIGYDSDNEEYRLQGVVGNDGFEVIGDDQAATLAIGKALVPLIAALP
jgi:hypothetical protein